MTEPLELIIDSEGIVRTLYDEVLELGAIGRLEIRRGSVVEPTAGGEWSADLGPCHGPVLRPFRHRSAALAAERAWLRRHWLMPPS